MASIKKVRTFLDETHAHLEILRARETDRDVLACLAGLHAAVSELSAIVRTDRV